MDKDEKIERMKELLTIIYPASIEDFEERKYPDDLKGCDARALYDIATEGMVELCEHIRSYPEGPDRCEEAGEQCLLESGNECPGKK